MELLPKVIYYSYNECMNKSKQTNFLTLRKLFWEAWHILNYITNQQKFSNDYFKGLKVPSHRIRLGLKCYGWIGLGEYKDLKW